MKKHIVLMGMIVLMIASGAAATNNSTADPGLVDIGHPLHGLEMAFDQVTLAIGVAAPADVAQERADEAAVALDSLTNNSTNETVETVTKGVAGTMVMAENIVNNSDVNNTAFSDVQSRLNEVQNKLQQKQSMIEDRLPDTVDSPFSGNESVSSRLSDVINTIPDNIGQ